MFLWEALRSRNSLVKKFNFTNNITSVTINACSRSTNFQICKLRSDMWQEKHIARPYVAFDSILCEALQHNIPPLTLPPHHTDNTYPFPWVVFRYEGNNEMRLLWTLYCCRVWSVLSVGYMQYIPLALCSLIMMICFFMIFLGKLLFCV